MTKGDMWYAGLCSKAGEPKVNGEKRTEGKTQGLRVAYETKEAITFHLEDGRFYKQYKLPF